MIRGVSKQIIEVKETDNLYYESAYLVVKPEFRQRRTSRVGTGSPQAPPCHGCTLRHQGAVQTVVPLAAAAGTGSAGRRHCHCVFRGNFAVIPVICKKMVSTFL